MLVTLLLIARAGCEWVEITQQHYRKPVIPSYQYSLTTEITGEKDIYTNNSVTEHQWNKTPNNSPTRFKIKPTDMNLENEGHSRRIGEVNTDAVPKGVTGNMKIISHVEKVDRVQLTNKPSKSSTLHLQPEVTRNGANLFKKELENQYHITSYNNFEPHHKIHMLTTTETVPNYYNNLHESKNYNHISQYDFKNYTVSKHKPLITDIESFEEVLNVNRFHRIPEIKSQNAEKIFVSTGRESIADISSEKPKVFAIDSLNTTADNEQLNTNNEIEYNKEQYNSNPEYIKTSNTERANGPVSSTEKSLPNQKSNGVDVIVKFVKLVSETILSNTRRGFSSKVRYLEDLKTNLLANIEERIEATWPDNNDKSRREIRATEGNARGHIEFPSSESTLMSISFLTFAVFLIKLVLQVIQTYKNKAMMVAPLVVATAGRAAHINHPQQKKQN